MMARGHRSGLGKSVMAVHVRLPNTNQQQMRRKHPEWVGTCQESTGGGGEGPSAPAKKNKEKKAGGNAKKGVATLLQGVS